MELPGIEPGTELSSVELGIPLAGRVSTFDGEGPRLWTCDNFELLRSAIGRHRCSRSLADSGRMREVGFLDQNTNTLLLPRPLLTDSEPVSDSVETRDGIFTGRLEEAMQFDVQAEVVPLVPAGMPEDTAGLLREMADWFTETCRLAAERGEFVSVVLGNEVPRPAPDHQVAFCAIDNESQWRVQVFATPIPPRSEMWDRPFLDIDNDCASLEAAAKPETMGVVGILIMAAIADGWRVDPYLLTVEYGVAPDGPAPRDVLWG